jgi:hypothetical protein
MRVKAKVVDRIDVPKDKLLLFEHARIREENLSQRELMQFCAIGCHFERCRFENTRFLDAQLGSGHEMSEYVECNFDGIRFNRGGGHARFVRCSFRNVILREWHARSTELIDCVFSGRLNTAVFCGTIPVAEERAFLRRDRNEFHGNDFSLLKMVDVDFGKGIDLTQQRLPSGPQYIYVADAAAAVARVQSGLETWNPTSEVHRIAIIIADVFKKAVDEGQQQLFVQLDTYYRLSEKIFPREAVDRVFALMRGD